MRIWDSYGVCVGERVGVTTTWFYVWSRARRNTGEVMEPDRETGASTRKGKENIRQRKASEDQAAPVKMKKRRGGDAAGDRVRFERQPVLQSSQSQLLKSFEKCGYE